MINSKHHHNSTRAGFTLTELIVAIGVTAVLMLAIGQLFRSIGGVVGTGVASAEIDQSARGIERQLRDDFDALNRMRAEDTFFAIRMREIGDVNRNNQLDDGETAVYLSEEDREADRRDGILPYEVDQAAGLTSRAITTRLDEIMFLAPASTGAEYISAQLDRRKNPNPAEQHLVLTAGADHARIYIGHALRPAPDLDFEFDPDASPPQLIPTRYYIPDGDFGTARTEMNRFAAPPFATGVNDGRAAGRNEFAGDWILARQALLLSGGAAAGFVPPNQAANDVPVAPIGNGREFAPYISDPTAFLRFNASPIDLQGVVDQDGEVGPTAVASAGGSLFTFDYPEPRLINWGRVDICAQDIIDVRRWLEGLEAPAASGATAVPGDASAYTIGAFDDVAILDAPLWQRRRTGSNTAVEATNLRGIRSAIASCFTRLLAESEAPPVKRRIEFQADQPEDALMDTHAVIASSCSRFEVAWSDGSTAQRDIELDGDATNGPEVREGDIIWFDISTARDDDPTTRRTARWWYRTFGASIDFRTNPGRDINDTRRDETHPEITPFDAINGAFPLLNIVENDLSLFTPPPPELPARYDIELTRAEPVPMGGGFDDRNEYLAIWPFRQVQGPEYGEPWPKDFLIRIRMTLHDQQLRFSQGKTFEMIFRVAPSAN
ncbi:MAG: prepilin-type N-terminal cleavage/methylation domain-containing protein [Planctomycetota bacterium]|nr:prepilin-type N-terminal cleavage/methylation domain-containing protein [Planctomycetota bacterium]